MAVRYIVKYGHPFLRMTAKPISKIDDSIRELVDDMIETMYFAEGIGLAAPQVAVSIALCVVDMGRIEEGASPKAFVNPMILHDEGSSSMEEGCLSIPGIQEEVPRADLIRVKFQDLFGKEHEETYEGLLARVLQHEIDHINGVLFVDRISSIKRKLLTKKLKKIAEESKSEARIPANIAIGGL
jgi:peptide deformylase